MNPMMAAPNQIAEVQMHGEMHYVTVALPGDKHPGRTPEQLAEDMTRLSREGYSIQFSSEHYLLLGRVVRYQKLSIDMSRVLLPVAPGGVRSN